MPCLFQNLRAGIQISSNFKQISFLVASRINNDDISWQSGCSWPGMTLDLFVFVEGLGAVATYAGSSTG